MSSYKKLIAFLLSFFFLIFTLSSCTSKDLRRDSKVFAQEDLYIVYALEYENSNNFKKARVFYKELFEKTKKEEYLIKKLKLDIILKDFAEAKAFSEEYLDEDFRAYEDIYRIYILSLLNLGEYDEALSEGKAFLEKFNSSINYELIANIYYLKKDYKNAFDYFESSYIVDRKESTLFNLVNILYLNMEKKKDAISYLETHIRLYNFSINIAKKLLFFYQRDKNSEGIISTVRKMYDYYEKEGMTKEKTQVGKILISYLEKSDVSSAIKFLEETNFDDGILLALYDRTKDYEKSLIILEKFYKKDKNLDILAQIAMLEFQNAKDKSKVVDSVIKKLKEVLSVIDNAMYQNFLGYILIDYDRDVKKGLHFVKKALEKEPDNYAFLDSLAWGKYKLKECKEAYSIMEDLVKRIGLEEEEISLHWNKIKECNK